MRWGGHPPPPKRAFPQFGGVSFYFFPFPTVFFPRSGVLSSRGDTAGVSWKTETDMETDTETGTKKGTGTGTEKEKEEKS